MTDNELQREFDKALKQLSSAEEAYVMAQNVCGLIDAEIDARHTAANKGVNKEPLKELVDRWSLNMRDILRAAEALKGDPVARHSLIRQADLMRSCISDLEKLLQDSQTTTIRT